MKANLTTKSIITKQAYNTLIQLSLAEIPCEACGILISNHSSSNPNGGNDTSGSLIIDTVIPIRNIHINPKQSFSFDPAEWTRLYFQIQTNRQSLVGLFHSHPETDATPSTSDLAGFLPATNLSYWIISLKNPSNPHVQPYFREGNIFVPHQLMLA